jgi:hypothetical protein
MSSFLLITEKEGQIIKIQYHDAQVRNVLNTDLMKVLKKDWPLYLKEGDFTTLKVWVWKSKSRRGKRVLLVEPVP